VGKLTREALLPQGKWEELDKHTAAYRSTVTEAANDVKVGAADAAIVYDAVVHGNPDVEPVRLTEFANTFADVKIGIVTDTTQLNEVRRFIRFLTASDRGLKRYAEHGFLPVDGAPWQEGNRP
jgi:molybdate transport system substrate-binding protein